MRLFITGGGAVLVAAGFVACGGSGSGNVGTPADAAPDVTAVSVTSEAGTDPGDAAAADAGACPATYAAATGSCTAPDPSATDPACVYPQGTCRCTERATCGPIVVPIEGDAATDPQWSCSAPRTDGCPETNPDGQKCTEEKKACSYRITCCTDIATCTNGSWVSRPGACAL